MAISKKQKSAVLDGLCNRLNSLMGNPETRFAENTSKGLKHNVYYLGWEYSGYGYSIFRIANEMGAERSYCSGKTYLEAVAYLEGMIQGVLFGKT